MRFATLGAHLPNLPSRSGQRGDIGKVKRRNGAPFLEQGEEVLAAVVARPRGWTQAGASAAGGALAGTIGGAIGGKKQQRSIEGA
jgi:hypothetical protein